jgi:hypothetical protein
MHDCNTLPDRFGAKMEWNEFAGGGFPPPPLTLEEKNHRWTCAQRQGGHTIGERGGEGLPSHPDSRNQSRGEGRGKMRSRMRLSWASVLRSRANSWVERCLQAEQDMIVSLSRGGKRADEHIGRVWFLSRRLRRRACGYSWPGPLGKLLEDSGIHSERFLLFFFAVTPRNIA